MTEKQKRLFKVCGAEVKMESSDGTLTIETKDLAYFMKKAYGLKPIADYSVKNYTYTVFTNSIRSDDVIIVKTVFNGLYIMLMPDFEIH